MPNFSLGVDLIVFPGLWLFFLDLIVFPAFFFISNFKPLPLTRALLFFWTLSWLRLALQLLCPHGNLTKAPRGRQGNAKLIARNKVFECLTLLKIEVLEKWASKWLEMHSQRQRFKKRSPDPTPMRRGFNSTLILSRLWLGLVQAICFQCPPSPPPRKQPLWVQPWERLVWSQALLLWVQQSGMKPNCISSIPTPAWSGLSTTCSNTLLHYWKSWLIVSLCKLKLHTKAICVVIISLLVFSFVNLRTMHDHDQLLRRLVLE